jgi:hypothetical protein
MTNSARRAETRSSTAWRSYVQWSGSVKPVNDVAMLARRSTYAKHA